MSLLLAALDAKFVALDSVEEYDPATDQWYPFASLNQARGQFQLSLLPDGSILAAGGVVIDSNVLRSAEVYSFKTGVLGARRSDADRKAGL